MVEAVREFVGIFTPPRRDDSAGYEPFPEPGEPVFTTHPAFKYDGGLQRALTAYKMQLWFITQNGWSGSATPAARKWVEGETPIPDERRATMIACRGRWLAEEKLLPDTPIGYQFLEGGEAAYRIPRRLDFIRRLFARGDKRQPASAPAPAAKPHALTAD